MSKGTAQTFILGQNHQIKKSSMLLMKHIDCIVQFMGQWTILNENNLLRRNRPSKHAMLCNASTRYSGDAFA